MISEEEYVRIEAEYQLGLAYLYGNNVQQNKELSAIWLRKAAKKGHAKAAETLSTLESNSSKTFYAHSLIHTTIRGERVRSKSEVIIANILYQYKVEYEYERPFHGTIERGSQHPDFTIFCFNGKLILWEHLGLMHKKEYRENWERKRNWYERNNIIIGQNLFISRDDENGIIDSQKIYEIAAHIKEIANQV